jgi:hypothetical protein
MADVVLRWRIAPPAELVLNWRIIGVLDPPILWSYSTINDCANGVVTVTADEGEVLTMSIKAAETAVCCSAEAIPASLPLPVTTKQTGVTYAFQFTADKDAALEFTIISDIRGIVAQDTVFHDCRAQKVLVQVASADVDAMFFRKPINNCWLNLKALHAAADSAYRTGQNANANRLLNYFHEYARCNCASCGCDNGCS